MRSSAAPAAAAAVLVLATGCGGGGAPATPDRVAVQWLEAKANYDGGKEWDLEAPGYRGTSDRKEAVDKRKRQKAQECATPGASGCLFPERVGFLTTGQRTEGRCLRVFVRDKGPEGMTHESAVILIRVNKQWRVRDWLATLPEDHLDLAAARDCGVS